VKYYNQLLNINVSAMTVHVSHDNSTINIVLGIVVDVVAAAAVVGVVTIFHKVV